MYKIKEYLYEFLIYKRLCFGYINKSYLICIILNR